MYHSRNSHARSTKEVRSCCPHRSDRTTRCHKGKSPMSRSHAPSKTSRRYQRHHSGCSASQLKSAMLVSAHRLLPGAPMRPELPRLGSAMPSLVEMRALREEECPRVSLLEQQWLCKTRGCSRVDPPLWGWLDSVPSGCYQSIKVLSPKKGAVQNITPACLRDDRQETQCRACIIGLLTVP
jgi:hypothetical protein